MSVSVLDGPTTAQPLSATSGSFSLTLSSGSNTVLVAEVKREIVAGPMTSITWNGVALTNKDVADSGGTFAAAEAWYLIAPASGTHTLAWTKTTGGTDHGAIVCYQLGGADQTTPLTSVKTGGASAAASNLTLSSVQSGDYCLDVVAVDGTGHSAVATGTGHSSDWGPVDSGAGTNEGYGGHSAATGSVPMNWTWTTSAPWAHIAVCVKAVAAAVGGGMPPVRIPNRYVGPQVLRFLYRQPQVFSSGPTAQTFAQGLDATTVLATATMQRQTNKGMTGTSVVVTASLVKQANKLVTATSVVVTASLQKQVNKTLTATAVVVTASLLALKVILKALTATTVIVTASIQKQVNKPLTATTIAVTASMQRQVNKVLTSSVVVTASLQALKVILKAMTATNVVVTASMQRQMNKPLVATTIAVTASVQKQVNKKLTATTVAVTASMQALKVIVKAMTATTVVVTASMVRQTQLHLSAPVSLSASITKRISKSLTASVSVLGSLVATFQGILIGPFAAAVAVADLQGTMVAASDASGVAVSTQDATGVVVTATDAAGTSTSTADASGVRVDVTDLLP